MNFSQIRNAPVQSGSRRAMNSLSQASGVRSGLLLSNPAARGQIAAAAVLAGWHGHGANGWWRHGGGGYGWVGPLFWPFAYYDIYDYTIWGDFGFWDYGYPDLYAGFFAPYGYDDLAGYMAGGGHGPRRAEFLRSRKCVAKAAAISPASRSNRSSRPSNRAKHRARAR